MDKRWLMAVAAAVDEIQEKSQVSNTSEVRIDEEKLLTMSVQTSSSPSGLSAESASTMLLTTEAEPSEKIHI